MNTRSGISHVHAGPSIIASPESTVDTENRGGKPLPAVAVYCRPCEQYVRRADLESHVESPEHVARVEYLERVIR